MQRLNYFVNIPAPAQQVWNCMLQHGSYEQWTSAFCPDSTYEGNWGPDEELKFIGPDGSGTMALIKAYEEHRLIDAAHTALLLKDGVTDADSSMAQQWIGTREIYRFQETAGNTVLEVEVHTHEAFADMFNQGWPKALEALKKLCIEQQETVTA